MLWAETFIPKYKQYPNLINDKILKLSYQSLLSRFCLLLFAATYYKKILNQKNFTSLASHWLEKFQGQ